MIPLTISMNERDNVAIVANDGGLPAGTTLYSGLVLKEHVPQGHKVALVDLASDAPVIRYGIPIGYAAQAILAGSWVSELLLKMPDARELDNLPIIANVDFGHTDPKITFPVGGEVNLVAKDGKAKIELIKH